jgi:hypothetical protein
MPHLQVEATSDQLLEAVAQLPPEELTTFVERVLTLRAERFASHVSGDEASLLVRINRALPVELQHRFDELVAARDAETLTAQEHDELLQLTDDIERFEAARAEALGELAGLRCTTVADVMRSLGIEQPPYA